MTIYDYHVAESKDTKHDSKKETNIRHYLLRKLALPDLP